nr:MAG TPA: hypothetical protein [Caudoviricetes sp.]
MVKPHERPISEASECERSELSFCCRSGRATARPLLNILLLSSLAKRSKHISFYLFNKASVSEPYYYSLFTFFLRK